MYQVSSTASEVQLDHDNLKFHERNTITTMLECVELHKIKTYLFFTMQYISTDINTKISVCLFVCLSVHVFLGHFVTDWETVWHKVALCFGKCSKTIKFLKKLFFAELLPFFYISLRFLCKFEERL